MLTDSPDQYYCLYCAEDNVRFSMLTDSPGQNYCLYCEEDNVHFSMLADYPGIVCTEVKSMLPHLQSYVLTLVLTTLWYFRRMLIQYKGSAGGTGETAAFYTRTSPGTRYITGETAAFYQRTSPRSKVKNRKNNCVLLVTSSGARWGTGGIANFYTRTGKTAAFYKRTSLGAR